MSTNGTRHRMPLSRRILTGLLELPTKIIPWYKLPTPLALGGLWAFRNRLREQNLYSTSAVAPGETGPTPTDGGTHNDRTYDGTYNDLQNPLMGSAGRRFGRNVPLHKAIPEAGEKLMTPNPREISRKLLARDTFKPATTLNLLAAAWIQFQTHDWFEHAPDLDNHMEVPVPDSDDWPHARPMVLQRTLASSPGVAGQEPPTFCNIRTHWWDASQIYGNDRETTESLRTHSDGKLIMGPDRLLPVDPVTNIDISGMTDNWWLGLSLLHHVFTLEHNVICDELKKVYPDWSDDELFRVARLINAALMAKIHTVEWTPAILGHPALQLAMKTNWSGLVSQKINKLLLAFVRDQEMRNGIPGSPTDHDGVDYALTEEFVSVYRMHPLIPDEVEFQSLSKSDFHRTEPMLNLSGGHVREMQNDIPMDDLFYTFGISHPGAITLHNYPEFLRNLQPLPRKGFPTAPGPIDMATIDIIRDRERGVPKYNDFRESLHMPRVKSFAQLTKNKVWQKELEEVYQDINRVDTMVGLFAEDPPPGFGFSDTAFRIFILMASRRLKSDRFFTNCYNAQTYTQTGLDWINNNNMITILLRHYPALQPSLSGVENAFAPWKRVH